MSPIRISGLKLNGDLILGKGDDYSIMTPLTSERTTNWDQVIKHEWTATWPFSATAQMYFDQGGELRLSGEVANSRLGSAQDFEWSEMLSNLGIMIFNKKQTFSTGLGVGSNIGFDDLTTSFQEIFRLESSLVYASHNYGLLEYLVKARLDADNIIRIQSLFMSQEINSADILHNVVTKTNIDSMAPVCETIIDLSAGGIS